MAKHKFVFCNQCNTMFLKTGKRCPGCSCYYTDSQTEDWELDPFEPQSWPFPKPKIRKSFYEKSTNEQYCVESSLSFYIERYFSHIFCALLSIGSLIFPFLVFPSEDWFSVGFITVFVMFIALAAFTGFMAYHTLERKFVSIDNNYLYIITAHGIIHEEVLQINRRWCSARVLHPSIRTPSGIQNGCTAALTYPIKSTEENLIIGSPTEMNLHTTVDNMRWLSMYLKYAYNEDLLPNPTPKLGHEDLKLDAAAQNSSLLGQPSVKHS